MAFFPGILMLSNNHSRRIPPEEKQRHFYITMLKEIFFNGQVHEDVVAV